VTIPDDGERKEFVRAVRSVSKRPRLIIIDTLACNFGAGNESVAQDMNAFVKGCDHLRAEFPGVTVLVVLHCGKEKKKGARGSLALQGATEAVFALSRSGDARRLVNEKQKDGVEAAPISLELVQIELADGNTSCVVRRNGVGADGVASTEPRTDPRTGETDAGVLRALGGFGPAGATLAQWRETSGRANDTFYRSRDRLTLACKARYDAENARYNVAEAETGPGPEPIQDGSNDPGPESESSSPPLKGTGLAGLDYPTEPELGVAVLAGEGHDSAAGTRKGVAPSRLPWEAARWTGIGPIRLALSETVGSARGAAVLRCQGTHIGRSGRTGSLKFRRQAILPRRLQYRDVLFLNRLTRKCSHPHFASCRSVREGLGPKSGNGAYGKSAIGKGCCVTLYAGLEIISIIVNHRFLVVMQNAQLIEQLLKFVRCKLGVLVYASLCILGIYLGPFPGFVRRHS
jgi:hypothetical protein